MGGLQTAFFYPADANLNISGLYADMPCMVQCLFFLGLLFVLDAHTDEAVSEKSIPQGIARVQFGELAQNGSISEVPAETGFKIPYLEIPRSWINEEHFAGLPPELQELAMANEEGSRIRFFISPYDEVHFQKVVRKLAEQKLDTAIKTLDLQALRSASRSSFLANGYSIKQSVTKALGFMSGTRIERSERTGGEDIPIYDRDVKANHSGWSIATSKLIKENQPEGAVFVPQYEMGAITLDDIDVSVLFRDTRDFLDDRKRFRPSFSGLNHPYKAAIELINDQPAENFYVARQEGLARANSAVDLLFFHRLVQDSSHSQNYVSEMNEFYVYTDRAAIRDFGDLVVFDALEDAFEPDRLEELKQKFPNRFRRTEFNKVGDGIFNLSASWERVNVPSTSKAELEAFSEAFYEGILVRLSEISGMSQDELRALGKFAKTKQGDYRFAIDTNTVEWKNLLAKIKSSATVTPPISQKKPIDRELALLVDAINSDNKKLISVISQVQSSEEKKRLAKAAMIAFLDNQNIERPASVPSEVVEKLFEYFQAEKGDDSLRLVLAETLVLVEAENQQALAFGMRYSKRTGVKLQVLETAERLLNAGAKLEEELVDALIRALPLENWLEVDAPPDSLNRKDFILKTRSRFDKLLTKVDLTTEQAGLLWPRIKSGSSQSDFLKAMPRIASLPENMRHVFGETLRRSFYLTGDGEAESMISLLERDPKAYPLLEELIAKATNDRAKTPFFDRRSVSKRIARLKNALRKSRNLARAGSGCWAFFSRKSNGSKMPQK